MSTPMTAKSDTEAIRANTREGEAWRIVALHNTDTVRLADYKPYNK